MLALFWELHDPSREAWSRQYANILFTHDAEQARRAAASAKRVGGRLGRRVATEIRPLAAFYNAEDYHQKYYLRRHAELLDEMRRYYESADDLRDSTAAARLNGWLGRYASAVAIEAEIDEIGLSLTGKRALLAEVAPRR